MANKENIDHFFNQNGPACVMVSYGIIINYFSSNKLSVDDVLGYFASYSGINSALTKLEREQAISDAYHGFCQPINMLGFDYICDIHNKLNTSSFCSIIKKRAELSDVPSDEVLLLKEELKIGNRLAMVLYLVSNNNAHAVVIGWDNSSCNYFLKDPNEAIPTSIDLLDTHNIREYILFDNI